jgi:large subunit ribosomal protein L14
LRNKAKITSKVKKGGIYKALIIRTKKIKRKKDGTLTFLNAKSLANAVVLINKKGLPIATRISEPVPNLLKKKRFTKFISISSGLI